MWLSGYTTNSSIIFTNIFISCEICFKDVNIITIIHLFEAGIADTIYSFKWRNIFMKNGIIFLLLADY